MAGRRQQRQWHGGWLVEDEQEDAAEDEAVVLEEDLSDEEANSAGPVKWVMPVWEVLAADRGGWRAPEAPISDQHLPGACSQWPWTCGIAVGQ
jgi:hypothetical protein